jgi:crotonobetainyl-CoA:carnitine CoA-transferase CaiB-like acyl-CoA transferase
MNNLPLAGCKVLDLTRALAGPFCTMILADLGAEVTKVEPLPDGDMIRLWGTFSEKESIYYLSTNRNKKSIAIDLRQPKGLEIVTKLAEQADVLVENFKVGTTHEMGLDYETLSSRNPKLVYGSITGFGRGGPYEHHSGFDQIAQGMSGLMSLTGLGGAGVRIGIPVGDLTAGMWATIGIIAAIMQQRATGKGQRVETSLLASLIGLLSVQGQRYLTLGEIPSGGGNDHPLLAPYGVFETKDGAINIAVGTDAIWAKLCRATGLEDLIESPDYIDNTARRRNVQQLKLLLEQSLRSKSKQEWRDIFASLGVPAGPINSIEEALTDPHVLQTGLIESVDHPTLGRLAQLANPLKFSRIVEPLSKAPPPLLGEQSIEVIQQLGLSPADIKVLIDEKVIRDGRHRETPAHVAL